MDMQGNEWKGHEQEKLSPKEFDHCTCYSTPLSITSEWAAHFTCYPFFYCYLTLHVGLCPTAQSHGSFVTRIVIINAPAMDAKSIRQSCDSAAEGFLRR